MSLFEEGNKKFWMQNGGIVRQKYLHVDKVHKKVWKKITETKKIPAWFLPKLRTNSKQEQL